MGHEPAKEVDITAEPVELRHYDGHFAVRAQTTGHRAGLENLDTGISPQTPLR
jgi:hypothetical protein